jgi:hypothetical protein
MLLGVTPLAANARVRRWQFGLIFTKICPIPMSAAQTEPTAAMTPRIAFATMVGEEPFFLPLWIDHYSRFVPKSHLFILVDGEHRSLPAQAQGCQVIVLPHVTPGPGWDRARWQMISSFTTTLLHRFDVVAFNDVDEILLADPAGEDLLTLLARAQSVGVISPFALELMHRTDLEPSPLHAKAPILSQRRHARINASYCKPCITSRPLNWTIGGHYSDFPDLNLDPDLYLLHLRFADRDMLLERQNSRQALMTPTPEGAEVVAGAGWSKGAKEMEHFLQSFIDAGLPIEGDFSFEWQRKRIIKSWAYDPKDQIWRHDKLHNRKTYTIPPRFAGLF